MSFEKDLRKAVESIDIPEELLPVNIEAMLRNADRSAQKNTSADIDRSEKITAKKTNRTIIMRTIAAAAACIALAGGFAAVRQQTAKPVDIESEINYEAVQVQSMMSCTAFTREFTLIRKPTAKLPLPRTATVWKLSPMTLQSPMCPLLPKQLPLLRKRPLRIPHARILMPCALIFQMPIS